MGPLVDQGPQKLKYFQRILRGWAFLPTSGAFRQKADSKRGEENTIGRQFLAHYGSVQHDICQDSDPLLSLSLSICAEVGHSAASSSWGRTARQLSQVAAFQSWCAACTLEHTTSPVQHQWKLKGSQGLER